LPSAPVGSLCCANGTSACRHYFHASCLDNLQDRSCPICRTKFSIVKVFPNPIESPEEWFNFIDADNSGELSLQEVVDALQCQLKLDWRKISSDATILWSKWDVDNSGNISLEEFLDPETGVLTYLNQHYQNTNVIVEPPSIIDQSREWFIYWDEDHSQSLDKSEVCRALIKTFRLMGKNTTSISRTIDCIWSIFDTDESGEIEIDEFISPGNLADAICAQLAHVH
jgi:Ca2+-binding EF-hand superfamily protein